MDNNGKRTVINRQFILKIAFVAILFFALYLVVTWVSENIDVGFDSVLAALPLIFGILWGYSAAIGILVSGVFLAFVMPADPFIATLFIMTYASVALCSYRCFHALKKAKSNDYIYDSRGMLIFFVTVTVMAIELYTSLQFVLIGDIVQYLHSPGIMVFNTIWVALIFGIIILIAVSFFYRAPSVPHHEQTERWRYYLFVLFVIPPAMTLFIDGIPDEFKCYVAAADILIFVVVGLFGPSQPVCYNAAEFHSLKFKSFVSIFAIALVLALVIDFLFELMANFNATDANEQLMLFRVLSISAIMFSFILVSYIIEKKVTAPIYDITKRVKRDGESNNNEYDVLSNRLDFIAGNKEGVTGNEFTLYIGLTKRDGSAQFKVENARQMMDDICLRYVSGYISEESKGGYRGNHASVSEDVLVYKIFGAMDDQINRILDDILRELDQESVLVEKNGVSRWYYYGNTNK